jgi:hypothetical protein
MYYSQNSYLYPANTGLFTSSGVMQQWPVDPKGVGWTAYIYTPGGGNTTYCACAAVENSGSGNATKNDCSVFAAGNFYCVKNQQ